MNILYNSQSPWKNFLQMTFKDNSIENHYQLHRNKKISRKFIFVFLILGIIISCALISIEFSFPQALDTMCIKKTLPYIEMAFLFIKVMLLVFLSIDFKSRKFRSFVLISIFIVNNIHLALLGILFSDDLSFKVYSNLLFSYADIVISIIYLDVYLIEYYILFINLLIHLVYYLALFFLVFSESRKVIEFFVNSLIMKFFLVLVSFLLERNKRYVFFLMHTHNKKEEYNYKLLNNIKSGILVFNSNNITFLNDSFQNILNKCFNIRNNINSPEFIRKSNTFSLEDVNKLKEIKLNNDNIITEQARLVKFEETKRTSNHSCKANYLCILNSNEKSQANNIKEDQLASMYELLTDLEEVNENLPDEIKDKLRFSKESEESQSCSISYRRKHSEDRIIVQEGMIEDLKSDSKIPKVKFNIKRTKLLNHRQFLNELFTGLKDLAISTPNKEKTQSPDKLSCKLESEISYENTYLGTKYLKRPVITQRDVTKTPNSPHKLRNFTRSKTFIQDSCKQNSEEFYIDIYFRIEDDNLMLLCEDITRRKMHEESQARVKYHSLFLAKISHEFKNPIISIKEISNQIMNYCNSRTKESIMLIENICDYLIILVKDCSLMTELQSQDLNKGLKINYEGVSLRQIINFCECIAVNRIKSFGKPIDVRVNYASPDIKHLFFYSDEIRLKQIIINILTNSIKFTSAGAILINVEVNVKDVITIIIEDTGKGIDRKILDNIYDPYVRETSKLNQFGSGLGLLIVKDLIDKLNGTIEIESQVNKGTKTTLNIPMKPLKANKQLKKKSTNFLPLMKPKRYDSFKRHPSNSRKNVTNSFKLLPILHSCESPNHSDSIAPSGLISRNYSRKIFRGTPYSGSTRNI